MGEKKPQRANAAATGESEFLTVGSITQPTCIYCGTVRASFTGDPCQCDDAQERRAARDAEKDAMNAPKPIASIAPPLPKRDDGLALLRRQAAQEQAIAARAAARDAAWQDVLDQRLALAQQDIADRLRAADANADATVNTSGFDTDYGIIPWDDEIDLTPGLRRPGPR